MRMNFYKCKVRLAGTTTSEVPKDNVSAAEIMVLRHLHGFDSVVNPERTHAADTNSHEERARLNSIYGRARPEVVNAVFGPFGELPSDLDPATEEEAAAAAAAKEAAEAAKKKEIDEQVEAEVEKRMAALKAEQAAIERGREVNKTDNPKAGEQRSTLRLPTSGGKSK